MVWLEEQTTSDVVIDGFADDWIRRRRWLCPWVYKYAACCCPSRVGSSSCQVVCKDLTSPKKTTADYREEEELLQYLLLIFLECIGVLSRLQLHLGLLERRIHSGTCCWTRAISAKQLLSLYPTWRATISNWNVRKRHLLGMMGTNRWSRWEFK